MIGSLRHSGPGISGQDQLCQEEQGDQERIPPGRPGEQDKDQVRGNGEDQVTVVDIVVRTAACNK